MPRVKLAHAVRVRRGIGLERGADVAHESQGWFRRCPDAQYQGNLRGRIAEKMPLPARCHEHRSRCRFLRLIVAAHKQPSAEHVNGLVELVMRMRDRPSEVSGDG